jgi:iron complex transport system substrate-binding protein
MKLAGGAPMPVKNSSEYTEVNLEEIKGFDPEVILSCGLKESDERSQRCAKCLNPKPPCIRTVDDVANMQVFGETTAVRNNRVFTIYCEQSCHPGPYLIDGIEEMARAFHPESFYSSKTKRVFV